MVLAQVWQVGYTRTTNDTDGTNDTNDTDNWARTGQPLHGRTRRGTMQAVDKRTVTQSWHSSRWYEPAIYWGYLALLLLMPWAPLTGWQRVVVWLLLLLVLLLQSVVATRPAARSLALALTTLPLLRLALLLPVVTAVDPLLALPGALLVVLLVARIVMAQVRVPPLMPPPALRPFHALMLAATPGLGALLYLLAPVRLPALSLDALLLYAVGLFLTGFVLEVVLRGLLLPAADGVPLPGALVYAALAGLLVAMPGGAVLPLATPVVLGLLFGTMLRRSGAVLGVALIHGGSLVVGGVLLPWLVQHNTLSEMLPGGAVPSHLVLASLLAMTGALVGGLLVVARLARVPR